MPNDIVPTLKSVGEKNILYVMATRDEYLDELQSRFNPFICHVGPVEAALHLSSYLSKLPDVDAVISLGSAGSQTLNQTEVYQVSHISYRDMDASAFGFPKGETPFLGLPAIVPMQFNIPGIPKASLSTGAKVISGEGYNDIEADMVDMETWAIMRSCMVAGVPLIGLRGISDGIEPVAEYEDWTRYLLVVDQQLAKAVDVLEEAVKSGTLVLE